MNIFNIKNNVLACILLTYFLLFFNSCEQKEIIKKQNQSVNYDILPEQISYDVKVKFADSTFTKAVLFAKRARIFKKNQETILDLGVKVDFYSKSSGKKVSKLTSDSVVIDDVTKNMYAGGNVVVISDSTNTVLKTTLLEWNNKTQKLFSNEFVTITSPYETIRGYGFESDQNLSNYKIFKVSGEQRQNVK